MELNQIDTFVWEIPKTGGMRVPGRIYASAGMMSSISKEEAFKQVANVAHLPGIVTASLAMPDIHWGYGFPIGGVAAFDWDEGIISPGGVGYDINCGVRLSGTSLEEKDVRRCQEDLANALYQCIPCGVGSTGPVKLSKKEIKHVLEQGSAWAINRGYGQDADLEHTEDRGCMKNADPSEVSDRAIERGLKQLGTLGSGNHFLEVGVVDTIYESEIAGQFGLFQGQVTLMVHSGSRGLGHQICDDSLALMARHVKSLDFPLPDRQLSCAEIQSGQGQHYFNAMACAATSPAQ